MQRFFSAKWEALRTFWQRHTTPSAKITSPTERHMARTLAFTSIGMLVGILLPVAIGITLRPTPPAVRGYIYAIVPVVALTYYLSRTRYYRIGLRIMLLAYSLGSPVITTLTPNITFSTYALLVGWNIGALIIGAMMLVRPAYLLLLLVNLFFLGVPALLHQIPFKWFVDTSLVLLAEAAVLFGLAGAHRRHAAELAQSEQRFRDLFQSTLEGLAIHDGERILAVNPAFEKMFRCRAEDIIGKEPIQFVATEVREEAYRDFLAAQEDPQAIIRSTARRADGTTFIAEARTAPVVYEGRSVYAISIRDISKQVEAEQALAEERDLLKEILESIAAPFYVADAQDCHIIIANQAAEVAVTPETPGGYALLKRYRNCMDLPECPIKQVIQTGKPATIEHLHERMRNGKKEVYLAEVHVYPIKDATGNVHQVIIYAPDITARKQAEKEIRKLSRALEHTAHGIVITNLDGIIEYVNPAFTKMTGYAAEEAVGHSPRILRSGKHSHAFYDALWETIRTGQTWRGEIINRRKDGTLYWESQTIAPIKDDEGNITHYVAVKRDVTKRKQAEEKIRILQRAVDQAAHSVVITNRDGLIEYVNPAFTQVTGYTAEEVLGKNPRMLKSGKHPRSFYKEMWDTLAKGETWYGEFVNRRKDGTLYWERASIAPIKDAEGNITHYVAVKEDITKQKELEAELQRARDEALQASKFKTQLLGNVSHDMRTPLGGILGYSEMLMDGAFGELTEKQHAAVLRIMQSTQQLIEFTNDLINQAELESGRLRFHIQRFSPRELLKAIPASEAIAEAKGVRVHTEIDPQLPAEVYGDPYWLRQILANLLSNAVKFTDEGHIWIRLLAVNGDRWAIQVEDTGTGIPLEAQKHIFESFRQVDGSPTRRYKGSGLGLSIVQQLVDHMRGEILLESTPGKGSKFTVILPCQATLAEEQTP